MSRNILRFHTKLAAETLVHLRINGSSTFWKRMKPGAGPTPGIKIETGKDVWNSIPDNQKFDLEMEVDG